MPRAEYTSRAFRAKYPGQCSECDVRIDVGDMIRMGENGPQHTNCDLILKPSIPRKPEVVCGTCWLVKPCDCD